MSEQVPEWERLREQARELQAKALQLRLEAEAIEDAKKREIRNAERTDRVARYGEWYWAYVRGESYTAIAKRVGRAVTTVRHHAYAYKRQRSEHYDKVFRRWLRNEFPEVDTSFYSHDLDDPPATREKRWEKEKARQEIKIAKAVELAWRNARCRSRIVAADGTQITRHYWDHELTERDRAIVLRWTKENWPDARLEWVPDEELEPEA